VQHGKLRALLDGDIYAYRCASSAENEEVFIALSRVDAMINTTLDELGVDDYRIFTTGKGNFRYEINPEYKANRKDKPRAKWEIATKNYLADQWDAEVIDGMEADDALGIYQGKNTIICTIDKDLNQIAGWHYNPVKKEKYYIEEEEGIRFFWKQVLMGDSIDGVRGVRGIGPKKAESIIFEVPLPILPGTVKDCFETPEDFEVTAGCIWIRRNGAVTWKDYYDSKWGKEQGKTSAAVCEGSDPQDVPTP
jgi:DNA polymerase-1